MKNFLSPYTCRVLLPWIRCYSTGVNKSALSELRKRTGISFINCKKALEKFNNDLDEAEKWLLEQAQKEGWAKAMKLQSRPMSDGLIGMVSQTNAVTMIEVNCETDFVAKNEKFQNLVSRLTLACHEYFSSSSTGMTNLNKTDVNAITTGENGKTLSDLVALEVGTIGENMILRRAVSVKPSEDSILGTYIHSSGKNLAIDGCSMAKYGAVVELSRTGGDGADQLPLSEVCEQLCQHIVGMNPKVIGEPYQGSVSEDADEADTNENAAPSEQTQEKPSDGSDSDSDTESTVVKRKVEKVENRLLYQDFLLNEDLKVGDYLQENGLTVKNFVRFECGEELEESSS